MYALDDKASEKRPLEKIELMKLGFAKCIFGSRYEATIVFHKTLVSLKNGGFVTMAAYSSGVIDTLGAASRSSSSSQLLFFIWVYFFRFRVVCAALTPY